MKVLKESSQAWVSLLELELLYSSEFNKYFVQERVGPLWDFLMFLCLRQALLFRQGGDGTILVGIHPNYERNKGSRNG